MISAFGIDHGESIAKRRNPVSWTGHQAARLQGVHARAWRKGGNALVEGGEKRMAALPVNPKKWSDSDKVVARRAVREAKVGTGMTGWGAKSDKWAQRMHEHELATGAITLAPPTAVAGYGGYEAYRRRK